MITGYNTDVRYRSVNLHVQTEDKGQGNPYIESLVYVGGQVLVAKRASYAEMLANGKGEKEIVAMMDRQHRTMIAAIRHGKFDEKLRALLGAEASVEATLPPSPRPAPLAPPSSAGSPAQAAAVEAVRDRTLDQVILEYLTHEASQEHLVVTLEEQRNVALGKRAQLALTTTSSQGGRPVAAVSVTIKMISTTAGPRTLATGQTGRDGALRLDFDIPLLDRGTAALIVSAASAIGRAEVKQLL